MAKSKTEKRGIYLYIDGKEVVDNVNHIEKEIRKLTVAVKSMERGSEEYVRTTEKIRTLKGILAEHNSLLKDTGGSIRKNTAEAEKSHNHLGKMADGFNRYFGMVTSFIAGITGVFLTMRKAVADYLNLDSAYSDVMKYTGKTREEVVGLNEDLKKFDTKTARVELNALLSDAGKLGIKGKQDLLDFAYAGDVIRVSLGEDLGKDAIKNIGKLAQMFGDADTMGLKDAMLAIGSSINDIAQSSSASEPYLVEFTNRMAGIGKQADMTIPQIIGFASVLDQNAQQVEMASTALNGVMMKMFKDPAKLARIAGLEVTSFAKLVREDANEALLQLLSTLGNKGGMNKLAPIFDEMKLDGARASQVLSVLAGNVDKVRQQQQQATQAFKDGTSVVNEFNTKNNDLTAQMMKAKKIFQERVYQLGEQLLPIMTKLVSGSSMTIRMMNDLITLGIKYGDVIIALAAVTLSYVAAIKTYHAYTIITNFVTGIARLLSLKFAIAKANEALQLGRSAAATRIYNAEIAKHNILVSIGNKVSAVFKGTLYLLQTAFYLLTGQMAKARGAMVAFNLVTKLNPIAALITLFTAGAAAIWLYARRTDAATVAQKKLNDIRKDSISSIQKEKTEMENLYKIATNEKISKERRIDAIEQLNNISPEYLGNLNLENIKTDLARQSMDKYINSLIRKATIETELNRLAEINTKMAKYGNSATEYLTQEINAFEFIWNAFVHDTATPEWDEMLEEKKLLEEDIKKQQEELFNSTPEVRTLESVTKELENAKKVLADLEKTDTSFFNPGELIAYTAKLNAASFAVAKLTKEQKDLMKNATVETDEEREERIRKELEKIETEHLRKVAELKKEYMKSDTMTQLEYADRLEQLEMDKLDKQFAIAGLEPKKREEIANKILDYSIKLKEQLAELDKKSGLDPETQNQKELDAIRKKYDAMRSIVEKANKQNILSEEAKNKILNDIAKKQAYEENKNQEEHAKIVLKQKDKSLNKEVSLLNERRLSESLTEEQFNKELRELKIKHLTEMLEITGLSEEQITEIMDQIQTIRLEENKEKLEKEKQQVETYKDLVIDMATGIGEAMADIFTGQDDALKEFLKQMLLSAIQTVEAYIRIAYIKTLADSLIGLKGAKLAAGIAKIAAIEMAFAVAKGLVNNFYEGGFTPDGEWNKPQGIVHSNEFVSNRFAVANPHLRPVFDLIDYAQKTNTVGNLTGADVAAVAGGSSTISHVSGKSPSGQPSNLPADYSVMIALIGRMHKTMEQLDKRLGEPIFTYTKASGKYGINEAQELIEKMNSNASRKKNKL